MRALIPYVALVLGIPSSAAHAPRPSPALSPSEVVRAVVTALANNDSPLPNAGIYTAYHFASPRNRAVTGPYGHFLQIVRGEEARPLLQNHKTEFGSVEVAGDDAQQDVHLFSSTGLTLVYRFSLSRQPAGNCAGCWLVDGVVRITAPAKGSR